MIELPSRLHREHQQFQHLAWINPIPPPAESFPIVVKDNFVSPHHPSTAGSAMLAGHRASFEATVLTRLRNMGAHIAAVSHMDAFAMGAIGDACRWSTPRNPWSIAHRPGGSSSGSAVAVATGSVPIAIGSDTGGSVRVPAAWCGVYGLKPTYGALSRRGMLAFASRLDCPGIMGSSLAQLGRVFDAINAPDPGDIATQAPRAQTRPIKRLGIPKSWTEGLASPVAETLDRTLSTLERHGFQLRELTLPAGAAELYHQLSCLEASSNLSRYDGLRFGAPRRPGESKADYQNRLFEPHVLERIHQGKSLRPRAAQILSELEAYRIKMVHCFAEVDVLIGPTVYRCAPTLTELPDHTPYALFDRMTIPASLAGLPALSFPDIEQPHKLPVGIQLVGPRFSERRLLDVVDLLHGERPLPLPQNISR